MSTYDIKNKPFTSNNLNTKNLNNFERNTKKVGPYEIMEKIGEGTFSKVCVGKHTATGEKVAIKIIKKDDFIDSEDQIRVENEIKILKQIRHENIIQIFSVIETDKTVHIIMEYCQMGELFDQIISRNIMIESDACKIFHQLLSGVEYLHKIGIAHRDLKPENILLNSKREIKIADFGLSNLYGNKIFLKTSCGSPCYAAPEMIKGFEYKGSTVDIWSCGIILFTMICGYLPFEDDDQKKLFYKIVKGNLNFPNFISPAFKDFIKGLLNVDSDQRFTFEQIKDHYWFKTAIKDDISYLSPGLNLKEDIIPIDEDLILKLNEQLQLSIQEIIEDLICNKNNNTTTIYYLLLKKKIRNGDSSVAHISNKSNLFIQFFNSDKFKLKYYKYDFKSVIREYVDRINERLKVINRKSINLFGDDVSFWNLPDDFKQDSLDDFTKNNLSEMKNKIVSRKSLLSINDKQSTTNLKTVDTSFSKNNLLENKSFSIIEDKNYSDNNIVNKKNLSTSIDSTDKLFSNKSLYKVEFKNNTIDNKLKKSSEKKSYKDLYILKQNNNFNKSVEKIVEKNSEKKEEKSIDKIVDKKEDKRKISNFINDENDWSFSDDIKNMTNNKNDIKMENNINNEYMSINEINSNRYSSSDVLTNKILLSNKNLPEVTKSSKNSLFNNSFNFEEKIILDETYSNDNNYKLIKNSANKLTSSNSIENLKSTIDNNNNIESLSKSNNSYTSNKKTIIEDKNNIDKITNDSSTNIKPIKHSANKINTDDLSNNKLSLSDLHIIPLVINIKKEEIKEKIKLKEPKLEIDMQLNLNKGIFKNYRESKKRNSIKEDYDKYVRKSIQFNIQNKHLNENNSNLTEVSNNIRKTEENLNLTEVSSNEKSTPKEKKLITTTISSNEGNFINSILKTSEGEIKNNNFSKSIITKISQNEKVSNFEQIIKIENRKNISQPHTNIFKNEEFSTNTFRNIKTNILSHDRNKHNNNTNNISSAINIKNDNNNNNHSQIPTQINHFDYELKTDKNFKNIFCKNVIESIKFEIEKLCGKHSVTILKNTNMTTDLKCEYIYNYNNKLVFFLNVFKLNDFRDYFVIQFNSYKGDERIMKKIYDSIKRNLIF